MDSLEEMKAQIQKQKEENERMAHAEIEEICKKYKVVLVPEIKLSPNNMETAISIRSVE